MNMARSHVWCLAIVILASGWTSEAQSALDSTVDLTIENVEVDGLGGSFTVRGTPVNGVARAVGAYSVNLQFDNFSAELGDFLQFDASNQMPLMNELGGNFGTTPHPGILSAGETVTYIAFGDGSLPASGVDLLAVSFSVPGGFGTGASFVVDIVEGLAGTETFVQGFQLSLGQETIRSPVGLPCDIDGNSVCDAADIDFLGDQVREGSTDSVYDLDENGVVDAADRLFWVHDLMSTYVGDGNLDGRFDGTDFVNVFVAGEYFDSFESNSTWATGDWNGDREFDADDLVVAMIDGGYEAAGSVAASVPEPHGLILVSFALFVAPLFCTCRATIANGSVS